MSALRSHRVVAHGGMGAVAMPGAFAKACQVNAVLRPRDGVVRVWNGIAGAAEDFTIAEARALCIEGDRALTAERRQPDGCLALHFHCDADPEKFDLLLVDRDWFIALLAKMRRALRTLDVAKALAREAASAL